MSFINKLKRGFGFGIDDNDPLYADADDTPQKPDASALTDASASGAAAVAPAVSAAEPPTMSDDVRCAIFDHVVKVFNEAQPAFIREALDPEAQKHFIMQSLDQSIKDYLDMLTLRAQQSCEQQWLGEHNNLVAEMDALRNKTREIEAQRSEIQQRQLSADRQKRALADRVHDLEAQVAHLEAEREQFDLENKSLVNKLKVANFHSEEADALKAQIDSLNAEITTLRNDPNAATAELNDKISTLADENTALSQHNSELTAKCAELSERCDNLTEQMRVADGLYSDLRAKFATKTEELEKAVNMLGELEEIHSNMQKMADTMQKRKDKIDELKAENASLRQQLDELQRSQADAAADAPAAYIAEPAVADTADSAPMISEDDLSAMEETFENDDWMSNEPPAASLSILTAQQQRPDSDDDFGYHSPRKHSTPRDNNNGQMSLF
ncbi:MAG: hypothetical protein ACI306_06615 [Muribaculaceae bacterium]